MGEGSLGPGGKYCGVLANMLRKMKKRFVKTWGQYSKTEDQKKIKQNCFHRGYVRRCVYFAGRSDSRRWPATGREEKEKNSLSFSANPTKRPTGVRKNRKTREMVTTALNFWRLSLGVLYGLVKTMFARDGSKVAGSEVQGEGRERVQLI